MRLAELALFAASIGRTAYGKWRLQQVLAGVAVIMALTITLALLLSALALGTLYGGYLIMVNYGASSAMAMTIIWLFVLLLVLAIFTKMTRRLKKFKTAVNSPAGEVLDAFINGLMSK